MTEGNKSNMKTRQIQRIHENPHVLTAIAEYRQRGLHEQEICQRLRLSRATLYRCVRALQDIRDRAERDA
jgi:orotate phosphoribosyltransferase-like protein